MMLFYEIIQADCRLGVPLSEEAMQTLATKCHITSATRMLDLNCARGELLCQWAQRYDLKGTGVDERADLVRHAHERANELEVWANLHFVESDVMGYPQAFHQYNIVAHLGEALIQTDLSDTVATLRPAISDEQGGVLLLGQLFWQMPPSEEVCEALTMERDFLPSLGDFIDNLHAQDLDVQDFIIASPADWDVFHAQQWQIVRRWLADNKAHQAYDDIAHQLRMMQRVYFHYERDYLGWGIFIMPIAGTGKPDDLSDYGDW